MTDALHLDPLLALERAGWDALCSHDGGTFYGRLMTDEAVMVLVDGSVMDRATVVAALDQAPPWASYEIDEARVVPAGPGAAALVHRARAERDGGPPFEALMSSVYEVLDGEPRLVLDQQTALG